MESASGGHRYPPSVIDVPLARFEELVADALDAIPPELAGLLDNVAVVVEEGSLNGGLLGRYDGVPLTERGIWYGTGELVMPDRVTIFRRPICAMAHDEDEVVRQVGITVVHELAHHFGIGDARLHELGWG
jgi:predicted Zn-dependent protease with MMP-like domain